MIPTDPSMRCKFSFRARWRLNRKRRGFRPLQRMLFHIRNRRLKCNEGGEDN
jgi:hypothetical protein